MTDAELSALVREHGVIVDQEARRYVVRKVDRDDLRQAGFVGLLVAATRFDPSLGPFSAYARLWVRKEMQRLVATSEFSSVLPAELVGRVVALRRLADEPGHSMEHLAAAVGLSHATIASLLRSLVVAPRHEVPEPRSPRSVEDDALLAALGDALAEAVARLPLELRVVVDARFGFASDRPQSARAVGRLLGISPATVRSRTNRALSRLRAALGASDPRETDDHMTTSTKQLSWPEFGFELAVPSDWEVFPGEQAREIVRAKREAAELSLTLIVWKLPAHGASLAEFADSAKVPLEARGYHDIAIHEVQVGDRAAVSLHGVMADGWSTTQYYLGGATAVYVLGFGSAHADADQDQVTQIVRSFALL